MKKLKWDGTCHVIQDVPMRGLLMDMHSHGLQKYIGTEFQYVVNVGGMYFEERQYLFGQVAEKILNKQLKLENGKRFTVDGWNGAEFELFKTKDCFGDDIYRIIECDMNGKFPNDEGCSFGFNLQYKDIYNM